MLEVAFQHRLGALSFDIAFQAPPGLTVLFGRSGSGKSTVMNVVAGLLAPDQGQVRLRDRLLLDTKTGVDLPAHRRRMGTVFQDGRLFPHLDVRANLLYGARFAPRAAPRAELAEVVELLGIGDLLARRPAALSGGEKSRVAIGRALLSAPDLILADEPLAALDAARQREIMPYFERLRDTTGIPILYVTHAVAEVARLATSVVAIEGGRVIAQGAAADVLGDPGIAPTGRADVGALLSARIVRHHADGLTEVAAGPCALFLPRQTAAVGAQLRLRIAAQDVILAQSVPTGLSALNILAGTVASLHAAEDATVLVALDTAAGRVLARITARSAAQLDLAPGTPVHAIAKSVSVAPNTSKAPVGEVG